MGFKYTAIAQENVSNSITGRENEMSQNNGGGYAFQLDKFKSLTRFLVLGATEGTYYISQNKHQYQNTSNIIDCIKTDGEAVVKEISRVSVNDLAHKNDHAIFALALVFTHGNNAAKRLAMGEFSNIVRTGTHLFMFCEFIKAQRGFGRSVRHAINNWYNDKNDYGMALQVSKYQQREGWSHRDVFRLAHPKFDKAKNAIAQWAINKHPDFFQNNDATNLLIGVDTVRQATNVKDVVDLIQKHNLQREHIPTQYLNMPEVQEALLPHMGGTALLRNLGNMSSGGLIEPLSNASKLIIDKITSRDWLKSQRLHPLSIFLAQRVYSSGRGVLGSKTWRVDRNIVDALEGAFYASFDLVEPTRKNIMFCIDVSGSMGGKYPGINCSCTEIAAILAMASIRTEPYVFVGGFSEVFVDLNISKLDNLKSATEKCLMSNFGSTNPGAAIAFATEKKMPVDAFVVITDNEVNGGRHPTQQLNVYRKKIKKPDAKMIVCGLTATRFTIADPKDPNQLDIAGFSPDITSVISGFIKD